MTEDFGTREKHNREEKIRVSRRERHDQASVVYYGSRKVPIFHLFYFFILNFRDTILKIQHINLKIRQFNLKIRDN